MVKEIKRSTQSGYFMLLVLFVVQLVGIFGFVMAAQLHVVTLLILMIVVNIGIFIGWFGLYMVQPNEGKVLQLFGAYSGTDRENGLRWSNPFYMKKSVSLRVRNFDSDKIKVNDLDGNPIEIAAVVVWRVVDTAEAVFQVDDYEDFVNIQSESALRGLASRFPYDHNDSEDEISLRGHPQEVAVQLQKDIQARLTDAGVEVIEARISHLAYAPEIANAMLQRQQASAIIAARSRIVEGAVSMVEQALAKLAEREVVELDEERKAVMVSNLLVVLTADKSTQPVINAGSLY
ncbi:MAG: SPFH domain-containing protein [bacterium]